MWSKEHCILYVVFILYIYIFVNLNVYHNDSLVLNEKILTMFFVIVLLLGIYYIMYNKNHKKKLNILHWIITASYFICPFVFIHPTLIKLYLFLIFITFFSWFTNKKGCYLSAIQYDGKKHHIRNRFITKYKIDYIILIGLTIYIICKNNIPKKN